MFYGFAEVADWRAFQHFDQIREILENRRCNTSPSGREPIGLKLRDVRSAYSMDSFQTGCILAKLEPNPKADHNYQEVRLMRLVGRRSFPHRYREPYYWHRPSPVET
jgi:hypothetical protein